ncbi:MAG: ABC transporter ATP-binding protein [Sulfuriferula sp.]
MLNAIETTDICKHYGPTFALNGVSAVVPQGQVVGLLGHNGAGKSTLIKLALGLIAPTAGRISILGHEPSASTRELRTQIGYLPENIAFYGNLTGIEVIRYLETLKKSPKGQGTRLLERVGLGAAVRRRVGTYSKGMRQRLGLAQALLGSPELLLLDEPTTGLDPIATRDFYTIMHELRSTGKTIVICSHLLAELEPHLDRAIILGEGKLLAQGSMRELREMVGLPVTVVVRLAKGSDGLLREDWMSGLPVRLRPGAADVVEVDVPLGNKMEMLRRLIGMQAVEDVDIKQPTLARLYEMVGTRKMLGEGS